MDAALDKVKTLAKDLRTGFPRSPRDTAIGGFVIAGRALDKCRATLAGTNGEYHYDCSLDKRFFEFSGVNSEALKSFVATGASDLDVSAWVTANGRGRTEEEIALWNNKERDRRLSDLSPKSQVFMEKYIRENIPAGKIVYHYFDIYDLEEKRL